MKRKKIVVLLIFVLGVSYYIHERYYAKKNLSAPNIPLDYGDDSEGEKTSNKSCDNNIKPFNTVKIRIFGESKYAVQKLLGEPNKVLSSQMYSSWSVLIYYRKVRDEFDNNKVKHLAVWIERDNRLNSKVTKVKCITPNSYLRVGTSKIKLP